MAGTVNIELSYEEACVLIEHLEDLIADARAEKRPMLIELHSKLLGQSLRAETEENSEQSGEKNV